MRGAGWACLGGATLTINMRHAVTRRLRDPDRVLLCPLPRGFVERVVTVGGKGRTYKVPMSFSLVVYPLGG